MKVRFIILLFLCFCSISSTRNEYMDLPLSLADPYILKYNGKYYAYGTGYGKFSDGFFCYVSDDLRVWTLASHALKPEDSFGTRGFWAPEVYFKDNSFYMIYTAEEHVCIASSNSPLGPFVQKEHKPVIDEKSIDGTLFFDKEKTYLFFVRFTGGNVIWSAEMTESLDKIKPETLKMCIKAKDSWETDSSYPGLIAEGPSVIKQNGKYYLLYSANHYKNKKYGVGFAVSDTPDGPWIKSNKNPILQQPGNLFGTGHGAPFVGNNGKQYYVFHSHCSKDKISPRRLHITEMKVKRNHIKMSEEYFSPSLSNNGIYFNPVFEGAMADPSIVKGDDGLFYTYATGRNVKICKSKDLVSWERIADAFTDETRPNFEPNAGIWAPDVTKVGNKYVMYYSMSVWGGEWTCGIGVAIANKPEGPFVDYGKLFRSNEIGVKNSIDPFYIEENGKKYLFWGSFRGIYAIQLADDGLSIYPDASPTLVAGTAYEGTYIYKRNGYYYLFASIGSCCEGINSTYSTVVGRSTNLLGPYFNKAGEKMIDNCHEMLIHKSEKFIGPGHNSEIITDDAGNDWIMYHAYNIVKPKIRALMLDKIEWKEDWPFVYNQKPSLFSTCPIVYKK